MPNYYVAPNGTGNGNDRRDPANITLLADNTIPAGSTIYMRAGTYGSGGTTSYEVNLLGTATDPIEVRPLQSQVTIDGMFDLSESGGYTHFHELEITNSDTDRNVNDRAVAYFVRDAPGYKLINCVIHNVGHPAILPTAYTNGIEIYGCIMFYNGIYDPDPPYNGDPRGTPIYGQGSPAGVNLFLVEDCISFKNFMNGMKLYGQSAYVKNWTLRGVCNFNNPQTQFFVSTVNNPVEDVLLDECYFRLPVALEISGRFGGTELGYPGHSDGVNITLQDSTLWSVMTDDYRQTPLRIFDWDELNLTGNTIIATSEDGSSTRTVIDYENTVGGAVVECDENAYYGNSWYLTGSGALNFADWKTNTGFDANSTSADGLPASNEVVVRANKYKEGRGHIYIFNYENLDTVAVDVSSVLSAGDLYRVRDVENYFGTPVLEGRYDGLTLDIPMTGTDIATIIGDHDHLTEYGLLAHTGQDFGVFVVEKIIRSKHWKKFTLKCLPPFMRKGYDRRK